MLRCNFVATFPIRYFLLLSNINIFPYTEIGFQMYGFVSDRTVLRNQPKERITTALDEIFEDTFGDFKDMTIPDKFSFADEKNIEIHIGKNYYATSVNEDTKVDASIETDGKLIFFEAKLYSKISLPDENTPYDQIIRKLRVGLDVANRQNKEFYFLFRHCPNLLSAQIWRKVD